MTGFFIALAFLAILASLGSALFFMMRGGRGVDAKQKSRNMAWTLTARIALSVILFVCILLAWKFGLIQPTGLH